MAKKKPQHKELEDAVQKAWSSGNFLEAVEASNALTAADSTCGLAYHVRGMCYEKSGDVDAAQKEYAVARNLRYPPTINHLVDRGLHFGESATP